MLIELTPNGIEYTWELAGSQGASFMLFAKSEHTPEMVKSAKRYIRDSHDVVSLSIAKESDWDERYKSDYFRDPRTRELKWYQIEQDKKLIRQCRLAQMPPETFVEVHVLPHVKAVERRNFLLHGTRIYNL